ncbi:hypothetical protein KQI61_05920 [Anaerocolumna aminovalerica]|uniref:hypothetical protein n=1 Tax=Anaerocolumna aminovalerica TaxID=1527 RepID=UPI001C0ED5F5|nr:hypothetical protein [Anaerocolumna aminovalerica]MBU5331727.1 hypothetical protein [Anaerocolumna aminovalerica]
MEEYILKFHDNRELYFDVLIKVRNLGDKTQDEIYEYYSKNAKEVVENAFGFEDDGCWKLSYISKLDEIETLYFE